MKNLIPSYLTMEFARRDDCLDKMVPSDVRQLLGRIAELEQRVLTDEQIEQAGYLLRSQYMLDPQSQFPLTQFLKSIARVNATHE